MYSAVTQEGRNEHHLQLMQRLRAEELRLMSSDDDSSLASSPDVAATGSTGDEWEVAVTAERQRSEARARTRALELDLSMLRLQLYVDKLEQRWGSVRETAPVLVDTSLEEQYRNCVVVPQQKFMEWRRALQLSRQELEGGQERMAVQEGELPTPEAVDQAYKRARASWRVLHASLQQATNAAKAGALPLAAAGRGPSMREELDGMAQILQSNFMLSPAVTLW